MYNTYTVRKDEEKGEKKANEIFALGLKG